MAGADGRPVAQPGDDPPRRRTLVGTGVGRRMAAGAVVVAWLVVGAVASAFAMRQIDVAFVAPAPFVLAFLPWLAMTAVVPLVVGAVLRRRALVAVSTMVLVVAAAVYLPQISGGSREVAPGTATIRVVTANLFAGNDEVDEIVAAPIDVDADVIALQELTDEHWAAIEASELAASHPWSVVEPRPAPSGIGLLSRLPADDLAIVDIGLHPAAVATVSTPGGPIDVVNVHPPAPSPRSVAVWRDELRAVADLVAGFERPLVLGDLNATTDHPPLRAVMAAGGLSDAHRQAGEGWGGTWPSRERRVWDRRWPFPVLIRIDHVLVPDGVEATSVSTRPLVGSDHRLVVADLVVSPVERSGET
ncbi:MAG: endonuclease/exonuclease/phosphatase family protein [Acidimicrobiia bacterium]|nr:endonuclease/exonuclease/phosphatase family protein [Acidimicrobiia bacterium]